MSEARHVKTIVTAKRSLAGGAVIRGYAAKFNTLSQDLGGFVETIAPGAFDLANSPSVILNFDHDDRTILGRTESGTLKLTQDSIGLKFECELPARSPMIDVDGLIEMIGRGDLCGCSFVFSLAGENGDEWANTESGEVLRTLKKIVIYDVCVTQRPAYLDTDVSVSGRSKRATITGQRASAQLQLLRMLEKATRQTIEEQKRPEQRWVRDALGRRVCVTN